MQLMPISVLVSDRHCPYSGVDDCIAKASLLQKPVRCKSLYLSNLVEQVSSEPFSPNRSVIALDVDIF